MKDKVTIKSSNHSDIPSDWEVMTIEAIVKKEKGAIKIGPFGSQLKKEEFVVKGIKVYDQETAFSNDFFAGLNFITEEKFQTLKSCELKSGDLIISMMGTIGASAIVPPDAPKGILNSHLLRVRPDKSIANNEFLKLSISDSPITINQIKRKSHGGIMSGLSAGIMKSVELILPPLLEQKAIALILGLMDNAININNQLIAKKELHKKWLMQNLLTGKKRLKGFGGEWKEIHIRDVSKDLSIRNKTDKTLTVLSCTKYDGLVPSLEYFGRKIFADDLSTYKIVPKNHFAYATNHIEEGSIGYQEILDEALISPMYTVFKTDSSINDTFFYKLLKSHKLVYQYQNRMEGSIDRRGGLRWDAFSIIKIHLPSFEEQTAIAHVLQTADEEIQLLKTKTEKLKEQKRGMMQVLLTGKKRLKI